MALFEFELRPLKDVVPWGEPPNQRLSWFGLTDGIYYMNVGDQQLFRSSDEIIKLWSVEYPQMASASPYVDYQIVRLYEDLLEILPYALEPLPDVAIAFINTLENQRAWNRRLEEFFQLGEFDGQVDLYYDASRWLGCRTLSTLHLSMGPRIWMWREGDQIKVCWDNEGLVSDGVPHWTANNGEVRLSINDFMSEVQSFHDRLMAGMADRVQQILQENPFPASVDIDLRGLQSEHVQRTRSLTKALERNLEPIDWQRVEEANKAIISALEIKARV